MKVYLKSLVLVGVLLLVAAMQSCSPNFSITKQQKQTLIDSGYVKVITPRWVRKYRVTDSTLIINFKYRRVIKKPKWLWLRKNKNKKGSTVVSTSR